MMARRRSGSSDNVGCATIFALLLVIGLIVKYFWWIVAGIAIVGAIAATYVIARRVADHRAEAALRADELAYRAELESRRAQRRQSKDLFGLSITSEFPAEASKDQPAAAELPPLARTSAELKTLVKEEKEGWRWVAFGSVLSQRQAAVRSRLRDCRLGYSARATARLNTGVEVASFVTARMDALLRLTDQVETFMLAPAFKEVFGEPGDESTADADGIIQVANRLMDYHERFLELAEQCLGVDVPTLYTDLMRDCSDLMRIPLDGYEDFIDDFLKRLREMAELAPYARGPFEVDPVLLSFDLDGRLLDIITRRLKAAAKA
ncbi:MAG: hypothetical protein ACM4D3_21270 [Candidatus Sericytochromatia bacterium]